MNRSHSSTSSAGLFYTWLYYPVKQVKLFRLGILECPQLVVAAPLATGVLNPVGDGSVFSEHPLPLALSIARRASATLQLVHVHIVTSPLYDATGLASLDGRVDPLDLSREQVLHGRAHNLAVQRSVAQPCVELSAQSALDTGRAARPRC